MPARSSNALAERRKKKWYELRGPEGGWGGAWNRTKQLAAGAIEGTVANASEKPGYYRPAVLDAIPAVAGVVGALVNRRKDAKPFSGDTAVEQWINNSTRRALLASKRTNATLGISDPKNTAELGLRVAGSLLVPQPGKASVAKALVKVPGGTRVVQAAEKVAAVTPKPVRVAAKVAAEVATPLRQTSLKTAAPIGIAVTAGLDALLDQSVDPATGQRYQGTVPELLGMADEENAELEQEEFDDLDTLMMQTSVEAGDAEQDEIDAIMAPEISEPEVEMVEEEEKLGRFQQAAVAVGSVLTGAAALRYGNRYLQARHAASVAPENIPTFTGKKFRKSRMGSFGRVATAVAQQDLPIRNMAEEFLGRQYARQWGYRADRMTNVSIGSRTRHLFQTGELPGTNARTEKLAPLAEAYAKELDPQEQRLVSDALNAASALDDYKLTGTLAALNKDAAGNPVTPKQLEMLVQQVRGDPKLAKYFDGVQRSFDDLAKYRVMRGRDTLDAYKELRRKRPNYVVMNRNLERDVDVTLESRRYSANEDQGLGAARATEEGAGVQGPSGVGNPFISLFDEWTNEVRRADLNELRADFLVNMDASGALNAKGQQIIKQVSPNSTGDDIHIVRINGRQVAYRISDPHVNKALHMSPRASVKILEAMRQANQSMTTGALATVFNAFAAIKTPIYDTTMGMLTRPKGTAFGLVNEALGTNIPDPTALVSAYTGAARYLWDDMRGGIATSLRNNVIREHSWLKSIIGDDNLDNLATVFENAYENSIKADMDRHGITSITMHGSPDASELTSGVEQVAPNFADAAGNLLLEDISAARLAGDVSAFQAAIGRSRSAFVKGKSNMIVRAYGNVLEALHNGFRYSAHATNRGRVTNLDKHISDMRRLSADASQHGGSDRLNQALGSFAYANLGVQSLYELGRRAADNPANFLFNVGATISTAAALHYAAIGSDPDAAEKHSKKSPQQKASSLTTFGGNEIPLDPVMRLFTSALFPIYDQISGLNDGNYNSNFFEVMENWLEGDETAITEASALDQSIQLSQAVRDNNPFQLSSFPAANIALATAGVDVGMSRMTGETMMERTTNLTGLEDDVRRPDSIASAHTENMLAAMFSTVGRSLLGIADDAYRAYGASGNFNKALDLGTQKWKEGAVKGSGPLRSTLFGNYPSVESAADINFQLMKERDPGIEQAIKVLNTDVRAGGGERTNVRAKGSLAMPQEEGIVPPEIHGTELEYIARRANQLERLFLSKNRDALGDLGKIAESYGSQYLTTLESRNRNINAINEERRYQRLMMLTMTKKYEDYISQDIGRPFTFRDFNPKDYIRPMAEQPTE